MTWEKYTNRSGRSGVDSYELLSDGINVKFKNGGEYFYPEESNGSTVMGTMHSTADHGEFLNRFINSDKPEFVRGARGNEPTVKDNRILTETEKQKVSNLTDKYLKRNPSVADQLRMAKFRRMQSAETYDQWKKLKNK